MVNFDDDFDRADDISTNTSKIDKKKILFILIPVLIIIGLSVSFYYAFYRKITPAANYSIIKKSGAEKGDAETSTIFYDLPEISVNIKNTDGKPEIVKIKINIELGSVEDIKTIEILGAKINDAIISHTSELRDEEITGVSNLYWLKEELLYRINLITAPIKVGNLSFKNFEIQQNK